jgi:amino acid transporter
MPKSAFSGTIKGTLWLIPLMLFWMAWPNWGATLYGEVRGAKDFRKNIYQMAGGLFLPTGIVLIFLFLMNWKVGYQSWLGTYAAYWWGISPLGGDSISPTAMVSFLLPNSALQIILIGAASLILFGWFGTLFLSSTRMIFAAAFDRILPEWVAKVSSNGVPYNALILLMTIPSIIVASLYAGWPISWTNATSGVTWIKEISYDATLGIVIMFFFCGLAFMVMKWRARGVWENSSLPKTGLAGIPWMSILAAIYAVFMGWNIYMFIWDPLGAYAVGYKNKASFIFMLSLYGIAAVVWLVSYFVRKGQGMELEAVAKEIPVE